MHPSAIRHVARTLLALCLVVFATALPAADSDRAWRVTAVSGEVRIEGHADGMAVGDRLDAPFTVRTGPDGELRIARGEDRIDIGPVTEVEVAAPAAADEGPITRIRQALGSALYQVRHRMRNAFEVHTPHLVSVVKGTSFNILAARDATTVALVEGRLLVRTPDAGAEVFLDPGQAAIRAAGEDGIRVEDQREVSAPVRGPIRIARAEAHPPVRAGAAASHGGDRIGGVGTRQDGARTPGTAAGTLATADIEPTGAAASGRWSVVPDRALIPDSGGLQAGVGTDATLAVSSTTLDVGLDATIQGDIVGAGLRADAGLAIDPAGLDANLEAEIAAGLGPDIDVEIGAGIDAGLGSGLTASLDGNLGADLRAALGADLGSGFGADLEVDLGADLGAGPGSGLTAGLDTDIGANLGTDLGAGVSADIGLGAGGLDIEVNANVDLGIVGIDATIDGDDLLGSVGETAGGLLEDVGSTVGDTGSGLIGAIGGLLGR